MKIPSSKSAFKFVFDKGGWVAAFLMGLLGLPGLINSFRNELPSAAESAGLWRPIDERLSGDWAKVEQCTIDDPFFVGDLSGEEGINRNGSGLDISLRIREKRVDGDILATGLSQYHAYPEAMIIGEYSGQVANLRVFDWIGGKAATLAVVEVRKLSDDCLSFRTINQGGMLLPSSALLQKQDNGYFSSRTREGGIVQKVMNKLILKPKGEH